MLEKRVQVRNVSFLNRINNDSGSGAKRDLVTWRPDIGGDWYYLGPAATNSQSNPGTGLVVRELVPGSLVDIVGWEQVWNDAGSGKPTDYALWRGVAPSPEYVALASFFTRSHEPPTPAQTMGIKAIHRSVLARAFADYEIWTDAGTGARQDGAVWHVSDQGTIGLIETGAFVAVRGHNSRPTNVYCVDADKVVH